MASADLAESCLPPTLPAISDDLAALAENGGAPFEAVLRSWRGALGLSAASSSSCDTVPLRVEAALDLIGEAQARHILAGRSAAALAPPADPGAIARQRGALAACCASLRTARPAQHETPRQTLARLRAAAGSCTPSAASIPQAAAAPPTAAATATGAHAAVSASSPPLLSSDTLSAPADVATLNRIAEALAADYATRRAMLLKRLDVLVATFMHSERASDRKGEMLAAVQAVRSRLPPPPRFSADDVFRADESLLELQQVAKASTSAGVRRMLIGSVPDRGGRTGNEGAADAHAPYRSETFVQQERQREQNERGGKGQGKGGKGKGGGGARRHNDRGRGRGGN